MLLPYNRAQKKGVWNPTPCARNVASAQAQGSRHLFFVGDFRWPNGPWPGEKTPYFTAKTGHMARHGIWPSDRLCLHCPKKGVWNSPASINAGVFQRLKVPDTFFWSSRHGLVRWRPAWVRWPDGHSSFVTRYSSSSVRRRLMTSD